MKACIVSFSQKYVYENCSPVTTDTCCDRLKFDDNDDDDGEDDVDLQFEF